MDPDQLHGVAGVDHAALDAAGGHGATALDPEHVLDRHQEGLVDLPHRGGDVVVDRVHQLLDGGVLRGVLVGRARLQRLERRAADDRDVVAGEVVLAEELADLHLDQVDQHLVVDHVHLVEVDDQRRDLHLAGEQDVLTRLGHRAVGGRHDQDGAVHLRGAGDHVLDVVGVPRAVDVRVVARRRLVLHVADGDRDAALLLLRSVIDRIEGAEVSAALQGEVLGDRRGQGCLAVVDVTDGPDVDVWLAAVELLLCHGVSFVAPLALGLRDQLGGQVGRDF